MQNPKALFTIALDLIPRNKVVELLRQYDYKEEPSVELIYRAIEEQGEDFAHEFGELVQVAAKSPLAEAKVRSEIGLVSKGTGTYTGKTGKTDEQKQKTFDNFMTVFSGFGTFLTNVGGTGKSIIDSINAGNDAENENEYLKTILENQKSKQTLTVALIVAAAVIVLVIVVAALRRK